MSSRFALWKLIQSCQCFIGKSLCQLLCSRYARARLDNTYRFGTMITAISTAYPVNRLKQRFPQLRILKRINHRNCYIPLTHIAARRLADTLLRAAQVEKIIANLKGHADIVAISIQERADLRRGSRDHRAELAANRDQQSSLTANPQ
ncbi:hypothetical protein D3C77_488690 [compost metagenome]